MPTTRAYTKRNADAADLSSSSGSESPSKKPNLADVRNWDIEGLLTSDIRDFVLRATTLHPGARYMIERYRQHPCDGLSDLACRNVLRELVEQYESVRTGVTWLNSQRRAEAAVKVPTTVAAPIDAAATQVAALWNTGKRPATRVSIDLAKLEQKAYVAIHSLDGTECRRVKALSQTVSIL